MYAQTSGDTVACMSKRRCSIPLGGASIQHPGPHSDRLPVPLQVPVPMFIPVTMNSAERIVETIQDIKEKIPSDPFEAELILMAEMVAQQNEGNDKEKTQSEKRSEAKDRERQEAAPPDGT